MNFDKCSDLLPSLRINNTGSVAGVAARAPALAPALRHDSCDRAALTNTLLRAPRPRPRDIVLSFITVLIDNKSKIIDMTIEVSKLNR